jgi:hypothetical protein
VARQKGCDFGGPVSQAQLAEQVTDAMDGRLHGAALLTAPQAAQLLSLLGRQHDRYEGSHLTCLP